MRDMDKDKRDRRITLWALGIGAVALGIYITFLLMNMRA
jgi:hypothetical protein